jgi:hypothetical protein
MSNFALRKCDAFRKKNVEYDGVCAAMAQQTFTPHCEEALFDKGRSLQKTYRKNLQRGCAHASQQ